MLNLTTFLMKDFLKTFRIKIYCFFPSFTQKDLNHHPEMESEILFKFFANSSLILIYTSLIVGHVLLQISTCRNAMTLATSLIYGFMHLSKGRSKEETEFLQASTGLNPRIFRIAR